MKKNLTYTAWNASTISGMVRIENKVVTTLIALAYRESFPYTWHICVTVEADGVMMARKTISRIFVPSAEKEDR